LARLVEAAVVNLRDDALWQDALDKENEMKDELKGFAKEYRRKTE
jgi:hypothetical protein